MEISIVQMLDQISVGDWIVALPSRTLEIRVTAIGQSSVLAIDNNANEPKVLYTRIYKYKGQLVTENKQPYKKKK